MSSSSTTTQSHIYDAIVVGSGLAGLTASVQLLQAGKSVVLIEKLPRLGGNSIKASSGINGVPTIYQPSLEHDSVSAFKQDTLISGKGLCNEVLVDKLTQESASAISWLTEFAGVDLSAVTRLGGHSFARTHRGSGSLPPGFAIISALTKKLQAADNVRVLTDTKFERMIINKGEVKGIVIQLSHELETEDVFAKNVVLATGGFLADSELDNSFIRQYRPELGKYPLTNGEQTTGDGHRVAQSMLDANLIQMDQIQIHPTGFIQLKDNETPFSKWKFLCGELIRGIGGILINPQSGKRFCNELETRDKVTESISENCGENSFAVIVLSLEDYQKATSHVDFYISQKLMFKGNVKTLVDKIKEVNPESKIVAESALSGFQEYNDGVRAGKDEYQRATFGHAIGDEFVFGFVTPVLHFSMGGIEVNENSQVITKSGEIVNNVYAIGEVSAGVHGGNRLAGSSLLECVVFGTRVSKHISDES